MLSTHRAAWLILLAAAGILPACSGLEVKSDYDESADFSAYTTYVWGELPTPPEGEKASPRINDLLLRRVREAIEAKLETMGIRKVEQREDAGARVLFHINVAEKLRVPNDPYYAFYQVESYEEGTLVIDVVDMKTGKLAWRGTAQSRVQEHRTPQERQARIRDAVAAILDRYPN
jgi:hypothetical protein